MVTQRLAAKVKLKEKGKLEIITISLDLDCNAVCLLFFSSNPIWFSISIMVYLEVNSLFC